MDMAFECFEHWATCAGQQEGLLACKQIRATYPKVSLMEQVQKKTGQKDWLTWKTVIKTK